MVNSYTQEEANSKVISWIRQRTRWQKGYLLTFLIHTSRPKELIRDLGIRKSLQAIMIFGGNFFLPLFNPVLWTLWWGLCHKTRSLLCLKFHFRFIS